MDGRPFSEDDLLRYVHGRASHDLSARIEAAIDHDRSLAAEVSLMRGLGPAIERDDIGQIPGEFGWQRLKNEIEKEAVPEPHAAPPRFGDIWRIAAVVLGLAVLGQGAYIATSDGTAEAPVYGTASGPVDGPRLGIVLASDATMAQVNDLLRDAGASIVEGPSAIDMYRIGFETEEARDAALERFRQSPLIALVAQEEGR